MPSKQRRERVRELLDALPLERVRDVVVVDASRSELGEQRLRLLDAFGQRLADSPWSWKAAIVSNGIVFTVSGPMSSST